MKLISLLLLPIAVFALDQETIQRDTGFTTGLESINMVRFHSTASSCI
jgi:hypothetical protein